MDHQEDYDDYMDNPYEQNGHRMPEQHHSYMPEHQRGHPHHMPEHHPHHMPEQPRPCMPEQLPPPCMPETPYPPCMSEQQPCNGCNLCHQHPRYHMNNAPCEHANDKISDTQLLEYLMKIYKLDRSRLIAIFLRSQKNDIRNEILDNFYQDNFEFVKKRTSIDKQYFFFEKWNNSGIFITKEELDNYYHKYILKR